MANTGEKSIFFYYLLSRPYGDKIGHVTLFGSLAFLAILSTKFKSFAIGRLKVYLGAVVVILFVAIEEATQLFIASRSFDILDLLADGVGILLAAILSFFIQSKIQDSEKS